MVVYNPYRPVPKFPFLMFKYRLQATFIAIAVTCMTVFAVLDTAGFSGGKELLLSWIFALLHAFLGYVFVERGFRLEIKASIMMLLAGMALRFFLAVALVAIVIVSMPVSLPIFIGSFMVFFTFVLFAEVFYINAKTDRLKTAKLVIRNR